MFDQWIYDLERLIDRRFAARRVLLVECEGANWTAAIGDDVLYRHPSGKVVMKWSRTFADRTPGVVVELASIDSTDGYSVHVNTVVPA